MSFKVKTALREMLPSLDAEQLSADVYKSAGVFILRGAIPAETIAIWPDEWKKFRKSALYAEALARKRDAARSERTGRRVNGPVSAAIESCAFQLRKLGF
jgi:hypothetical protein